MSNTTFKTETADFFCAELSRETGEPMMGTAPTVDVWFLLEYDGPWTAKATADNDLPPAVQAWLTRALTLTNKGRIQFIKHNRSSTTAGITLFVALAREIAPLLYEFHLPSYDDLYSLDLARLLADATVDDQCRSDPLYLVCTNGRRDRCCSRLGLGLCQALDSLVGDAAWQTTHLGGHRFAPTMVAFPDGVCYGRLTTAALPHLVQTQEAGELYLNHLRGRGCYSDVVQAAEYFLRQETGALAHGDYRLLDAQRKDESRWLVHFAAPATNETHQLLVSRTLSEPARLVSCSPAKSKPVAHFHLVSIN